jgi:hypothetical protein
MFSQLSGTVLQFTFTLMLAASIPWVRNRFYELFKFVHVFLAILFMIFFFWHIKGEAITVSTASHLLFLAELTIDSPITSTALLAYCF